MKTETKECWQTKAEHKDETGEGTIRKTLKELNTLEITNTK